MCLKVAIVGAGPAGLEAALELSKGGITPTVYEKEDGTEHPTRCGEALFDLYRFFDSDPPGSRARISDLIVTIENTHHFPADNMGVWIMDKRGWLKEMGKDLESRGVAMERGRTVLLSDLRREFDYVLDCSGCPSQANREYGVEYGTLGLAIQYRVSANLSDRFGRLYFHYFPGEVGFRWIFPKSRKESNIGVGWANNPPHQKWETLDNFAREYLEDFNVKERVAGCIPMQLPPQLKLDNVMLCGDAGGLVNPYHGGGIHNALLSGRTAARCLLEGAPDSYDERLRDAVSGELKVAAFARSILEGSFRHHEMMVSYLEKNVPLEMLFTHDTHRKLLPFIQIWNLRSILKKSHIPSI